ncbi:hypothetical protein Tco_1080245 [Tanacetum coccineum]|uniref:Uncharacterized protein n=1 Tax=Tanacetum coccineum TaxID=301880 RepID=A0ABQ5HUQ1_9ASTR
MPATRSLHSVSNTSLRIWCRSVISSVSSPNDPKSRVFPPNAIQRQLLASVKYRRTIIEELEHLPGNLVANKMREHLKRIQKAVLVEVIELKKELRL